MIKAPVVPFLDMASTGQLSSQGAGDSHCQQTFGTIRPSGMALLTIILAFKGLNSPSCLKEQIITQSPHRVHFSQSTNRIFAIL
jgi:hypothetical protein